MSLYRGALKPWPGDGGVRRLVMKGSPRRLVAHPVAAGGCLSRSAPGRAGPRGCRLDSGGSNPSLNSVGRTRAPRSRREAGVARPRAWGWPTGGGGIFWRLAWDPESEGFRLSLCPRAAAPGAAAAGACGPSPVHDLERPIRPAGQVAGEAPR